MIKSIDKAKQDVEKAKQKFERAKKDLEVAERVASGNATEREFAEALHEKLCNWNHTDGCDWHYGSWENPTHAHSKYLMKARNLVEAGFDLSTVQQYYAALDKK